MTRALLDVNALIALLDGSHVDHLRARAWLTANIRILSQPRYPRSLTPGRATAMLAAACRTPHHECWSCHNSLLDDRVIDAARLHGPCQVTDSYLLALAVGHGGRLVTFDPSVVLSAVVGAQVQHVDVF